MKLNYFIPGSGRGSIKFLLATVLVLAFVVSSCTKLNISASDTTPPTISGITPLSNATSVSVSTTVKVTFSELMDASTISASTIGLKQGASVIPGTVTYSGKIATFTPSSALSAGTVYTALVTSSVKDTAGNALASSYTWTFTTASSSSSTGLSFATDVVPVLTLCNNCHTHGWTTSSNSSTFYTNLVNGGYVNPSSYTSSKIYSKINSGHASSISSANRNKIITWMTEGSKNN